MYLVTKRTMNKAISQEIWISNVAAEIRRSLINKTSDEYSGAIVESITPADQAKVEPKPIQVNYDGGGWNNLQMMIEFNAGFHLIVEVEMGFEAKADVTLQPKITTVYYFDEEHDCEEIELPREILEKLDKEIAEQQHERLTDMTLDYIGI